MCDFKPGDEVVVVWLGGPRDEARTSLKIGDRCTITQNLPGGGVLIAEAPPPPPTRGWREACFRKVQRRDLSAWLETATDFEEPKRTPAKKKERA